MLIWLVVILPILAVEYGIYAARNVKKWEDLHKDQADFLPFRRKDMDLWSRPKLYAGAILFLWVRILVVLLSVVLEWAALKYIFYGEDLTRLPLSPQKAKTCRRVTRVLTRMLLLGLGYWRLKEVGRPSRDVPMIISNHVSFIDILYLMTSKASPSFVSKAEVKNWLCIGLIATSLQCVFIERGGDSRAIALQKISERQLAIQSGQSFPQLTIFAEGTTTNGTALLQFRKGGFVNLMPVQPVFLDYPYSHVSPALDCVPLWTVVLLLCSQFYNSLHVTWLPVSEADGLTALDYANQVQRDLASVKRLPTSVATFEDKTTLLEAIKRV